MRILARITLSSLLAFGLSVSAIAGPINGSEALAGIGVTAKIDSGDPYGITASILAANFFRMSSLAISSGSGDFAPDTTVTITGPFVLDVSGGVGPNSFTITDLGGWGEFVATTLVFDHVGTEDRAFGLLGNFTPGPKQLPDTTSSSASLVMSFTQSGLAGNTISESLSLHSPAEFVGAPEPATLGVFGAALIGLGLLRRRRAA